MTKKQIIVLISGIISVGIAIVGIFGTYKLCSNGLSCIDILHTLFILLLPVVPLFIFSLITYKMRKEVFDAWGTFAIVWIPLSMLSILIAPEYGNAFIPVEKGTVALASSLLFAIISTGIILWKYFTKPAK